MASKSVCVFCTSAARLARSKSSSTSILQSRSYTSQTSEPRAFEYAAPNSIAVLGGGITGLATAVFIKYFLPKARITLIEAESRVGGWLHSTKTSIPTGNIIFERGPRSLRPSFNAAGLATWFLIRVIGIEGDRLLTYKNSPAATNRYVYHSDRLLRLPHPTDGLGLVWSLLSPPWYNDITKPAWKELWQPARNDQLQDETIGDFFRRRFSVSMTENLVSAGIHGIYAGDVNRLSMRTIFPALWDLEGRYGSLGKSVVANMLSSGNRRTVMPEADFILLRILGKLLEHPDKVAIFKGMKATSVYTFRGGLERITRTIENELQKDLPGEKVSLRLNTKVSALRSSTRTPGAIRVSTTGSTCGVEEFDHVVSALPSSALLPTLCGKGSPPPILQQDEARELTVPSVTVMVVNLYYDDPRLLSQHGFGYLLPQSLEYEQNPEFGLGVVFDSEATPMLDAGTGTKLTVMLGGHWWNGWTSFPSESEGIDLAKSLVSRQLRITLEPTRAMATLQKDCIPQYEVGHAQRAAKLSDKLDHAFGSHLEVVGASWSGVSVNDCIKAAFKAAWNASGGYPQFDILQSVDWSYQPIGSYPVHEVEESIYGGSRT